MKDFFNTFVAVAISENIKDLQYWSQQQDTGDFLQALFAILKNPDAILEAPDLDGQGVEFGNTEIRNVIYTECSHCNKTQEASTTYPRNHTLMIATSDASSYKVDFETILNHKMKSIEKVSGQSCALCSEDKKNRNLKENCSPENGNKDEEINEASENEDKKSESIRDCYFKSNYIFGADQKYVLVSMTKALRGNYEDTRKIHYQLPVGDFNLRGYGWFKVWAVLLYNGGKSGDRSSGHYYVMNDNGMYDDHIVHYNPDYFDNLKKKGFHSVLQGKHGYIVMLVLKRSDSSNMLPPPLIGIVFPMRKVAMGVVKQTILIRYVMALVVCACLVTVTTARQLMSMECRVVMVNHTNLIVAVAVAAAVTVAVAEAEAIAVTVAKAEKKRKAKAVTVAEAEKQREAKAVTVAETEKKREAKAVTVAEAEKTGEAQV
jgi:hypothetical protein